MSNLFKYSCLPQLVFPFFAYLCLIHRLSKICFGLYKHALIGTLHLPLPNENFNLPRRRRVLGRFSCAYIGYLRNLLFCKIVVCHRFHVSPQIKDVRQARCLVFVPSPLCPPSPNTKNVQTPFTFICPHFHFRLFYFLYLNVGFSPSVIDVHGVSVVSDP